MTCVFLSALRCWNLPLNPVQVFSLPPDVVGRGEDFFVLNVTERETMLFGDQNFWVFFWIINCRIIYNNFHWEHLLCRRDCQTHWCWVRWSWGCYTGNPLQSSFPGKWSGCSSGNQLSLSSGQNWIGCRRPESRVQSFLETAKGLFFLESQSHRCKYENEAKATREKKLSEEPSIRPTLKICSRQLRILNMFRSLA